MTDRIARSMFVLDLSEDEAIELMFYVRRAAAWVEGDGLRALLRKVDEQLCEHLTEDAAGDA